MSEGRARLGVALALAGTGVWLLWAGLVRVPHPHDNDWPLLMWLADRASPSDVSPLAVGHYGPLQLVLVDALWPLFGSTLAAAKVLNAAAVLVAGWLVFRLARGFGGTLAGFGALALYLSSAEVLLTGQSEFADPLALAAWLGGVSLAVSGRSLVAAGALLGLAGGFRLHFTPFAFATAVALLATAGLERRLRGRDALRLGVGLVVGLAPAGWIFWRVHGTWSSPIAHTFLGQVLFGADEYDMLATYDRHPFSDVVRSHVPELLAFVGRRLGEFPRPFWALAAATGLLALPAARRAGWRPAALAALALVYYLAFVVMAWGWTWRLALPLLAILAVCAAVAVTRAFRPWVAAVVLAGIALARAAEDLPRAYATLARVAALGERSATVTAALRGNGMTEPREAFAVDWNLWPVDDPKTIAFYNFGFWNLLHPGFRAERPNPIHTVDDPALFADFLRDHGVRLVVLPRAHPRFLALAAVARGERAMPGFRRVAVLGDDVVLRRDAPP